MASADRPARDTLLITLGFPPARGGIQSCLYARARLAAERIVVLAPDMPGAADFDAKQPFPVHRWPAICAHTPAIKRLCQFVFPLVHAGRLCDAYDIRRVECGQALPFGLVAWRLRAARGIHYRVWAFGDDIIKPARWPLARPMLRSILRRAETILAISHFTRQQILPLDIPDERIQVIYPPLYPTPQREEPADSAEGTTLLTVARLEARKGIEAIIEMTPALRERIPGLRYVIAGEGPARRPLESLARRLGVTETVQFVGDVSDAQRSALYAKCDLFVMLPTPAHDRGEVEGFGMVYLEAAAHGRPCVAWDNGGVTEAVIHEQTGLVVAEGDVEAARQAIVTLLENRGLRDTLGEQARVWAATMHQRSTRAIQALDIGHEWE
jgi:phosphatidyl-myo-inositol dimannoside synthase